MATIAKGSHVTIKRVAFSLQVHHLCQDYTEPVNSLRVAPLCMFEYAINPNNLRINNLCVYKYLTNTFGLRHWVTDQHPI